jgi:hypothetical protein
LPAIGGEPNRVVVSVEQGDRRHLLPGDVGVDLVERLHEDARLIEHELAVDGRPAADRSRQPHAAEQRHRCHRDAGDCRQGDMPRLESHAPRLRAMTSAADA